MAEDRSVYVIALHEKNVSQGLIDVERAEFLGVPCLKGRSHYVGDYERLNGRTVFVPLTQIQSVTQYASEADYRQAMEAMAAARKKKERGKKLLWTIFAVAWVAMMASIALEGWFHSRK